MTEEMKKELCFDLSRIAQIDDLDEVAPALVLLAYRWEECDTLCHHLRKVIDDLGLDETRTPAQ